VDLKFICKIMAHDLKINIGSKFVLNALHPKAFDGRSCLLFHIRCTKLSDKAYTHSHNLKKVIEKIQKQELDDENNNDDGEDETDEKGKKNKPGLKKGFSVGTSVMSPIKPMLARYVSLITLIFSC
jgi:DNA ligase-3